jgi:methylmalonyl-CoA/ethylmalonyl-CoA epimerase
MDYKVDHIGIAVNSLKTSIPLYERLLGESCYKTEQVSSESVDTAFFLQNGAKIELLESLDPNGPIAKFIGK